MRYDGVDAVRRPFAAEPLGRRFGADAVSWAAERLARLSGTPLAAAAPSDRAEPTPAPLVQAAHELQRASEQLRQEQREQTTRLVLDLLGASTGDVRSVTVDPNRSTALLLVDRFLLRATVGRSSQALALLTALRRAPVMLDGACVLPDDRALLSFTDGEDVLPLVVESLTRVHA